MNGLGLTVVVERGAGLLSRIADEDFKAAGAAIGKRRAMPAGPMSC